MFEEASETERRRESVGVAACRGVRAGASYGEGVSVQQDKRDPQELAEEELVLVREVGQVRDV